jgi:hypothetical protein
MTRITRIYADISTSLNTSKGNNPDRRCIEPVEIDLILVENATPHDTPHPVRDARTGFNGCIPNGMPLSGGTSFSTNISSLTGCKIRENPRYPRSKISENNQSKIKQNEQTHHF